MTVDGRAKPARPPVTQSSTDASAQESELTAGIEKQAFRGDDYVDSDALVNELDQRESQRFFIVPDGSGGKQMLEAGKIGAGPPRMSAPEEPVTSVQWQVCRVIVPLLEQKPFRRYDVHFPATDENDVVYAGFLLGAPDNSERAMLQVWTRKGERAAPVLARVDGQGRVLSIVNNMPTQSVPETNFRYASVVASISLTNPGNTRYALLDGARLRGKLPSTCGLNVPDEASAGLVTLQFSGSGEE